MYHGNCGKEIESEIVFVSFVVCLLGKARGGMVTGFTVRTRILLSALWH